MYAVRDGVVGGGFELGNVEDGMDTAESVGEFNGVGMGTGFSDNFKWAEILL